MAACRKVGSRCSPRYWSASGWVFLAELGDKSQLITLDVCAAASVVGGLEGWVSPLSWCMASRWRSATSWVRTSLNGRLPSSRRRLSSAFRSGPSARTRRVSDRLRVVDRPGARVVNRHPRARFVVLAIVSSFVLAELGTRPCWRRWLWRVTTTGRVSGSGPRRDGGGRWCGHSCRYPSASPVAGEVSASGGRCCSCCSDCGSCSTPCSDGDAVAIAVAAAAGVTSVAAAAIRLLCRGAARQTNAAKLSRPF